MVVKKIFLFPFPLLSEGLWQLLQHKTFHNCHSLEIAENIKHFLEWHYGQFHLKLEPRFPFIDIWLFQRLTMLKMRFYLQTNSVENKPSDQALNLYFVSILKVKGRLKFKPILKHLCEVSSFFACFFVSTVFYKCRKCTQ